MRPLTVLVLHITLPALLLALAVGVAMSYREWSCSDLKSDPVMVHLPSPPRCTK